MAPRSFSGYKIDPEQSPVLSLNPWIGDFERSSAVFGEHEALRDILTTTPGLAEHIATHRPTIIVDKGYCSHDFEAELADAGITVLRPTRKGEQPRPGQRFLKPLRQIIESVNDTFKGQLGLEQHGGRTIAGVCARVAQRVLALTAAIWHNDHHGAHTRRSLLAYDH